MSDAPVLKAVILAGGRGTRLAPFTTVLPKPLVPVGGVPILETVLRQLSFHGFQETVLAVGYLSSLIRAYLGEAEISRRMRIRYHEEQKPLGTAGPLASVEGFDDDFLFMNGDLLTTLDYAAMMRFHREQNAALSIAVVDRHMQIELGVLGINAASEVVSYTEKPSHSYAASMGIYACSPSIRRYIEPGVPLDVPTLVLRLIAAGEKVVGFRSECFWLDMGNPTDYARATEAFEQNRAAFLRDEVLA